MNREDQFKEFLATQTGHWSLVFENSKQYNKAARLTASIFMDILAVFEREGWDKTYVWLTNQVASLQGKSERLARILRNGYKQSKDKMWSINRKWEKTTRQKG